jgi:hypothetical protein
VPRRNYVVGLCILAAACIGLDLELATGAELPDAPERALVLRYCLACHTATRIERSGGSVSTWEDRLQRMVRWGARIPTGEITAVATYLAKALPVRARPESSLTYFANTAVSVAAWQSVVATQREAAVIDADGRSLTLWLQPSVAHLVKPGQRVRVFSPASRSSMNSAIVALLTPEAGRVRTTARLSALADGATTGPCLAELMLDLGTYLAVPNEAIIQSGDEQLVYVRVPDGSYLPRVVESGLQGDRLTQILSGLHAGEQVVTLGGFFIDAEYRLKSGG